VPLGALGKCCLKPNVEAKSDVWKHFSLIYGKKDEGASASTSEQVNDVENLLVEAKFSVLAINATRFTNTRTPMVQVLALKT
jgi:hypothetical protein